MSITRHSQPESGGEPKQETRYFIPRQNFNSLNAGFDRCTEDYAEAIRLLTQAPLHCPW